MTTQARSSYLPSEILWGHRFQSLISFKKDSGEYEVDYALFNNTIEVDTPLCSAKKLDEHKAALSLDCGGGKCHFLFTYINILNNNILNLPSSEFCLNSVNIGTKIEFNICYALRLSKFEHGNRASNYKKLSHN